METTVIFDATWRFFLGRFLLDMATVLIISMGFYYRRGKGDREYLFTYITASLAVFIVCLLVSKVKVELGMALGLFAVFSVIRFRSVQATPRELSYLFVCMGISLAIALVPADTPFLRLGTNILIVLLAIGMTEFFIFRNRLAEKVITYDRLDLLQEEKRDELEADLRIRFGITGVTRIQVGNIDSTKNRVKLKVRIRDAGNAHFRED